jgi:hypothetical protein
MQNNGKRPRAQSSQIKVQQAGPSKYATRNKKERRQQAGERRGPRPPERSCSQAVISKAPLLFFKVCVRGGNQSMGACSWQKLVACTRAVAK